MADYAAVKRRVLKIIASRGGEIVWAGEVLQNEATIGRSPGAHVVLDDPLVSWIHARVSLGAKGIVFADSSTNGSFRNGERVTEVSLGPGGIVSIPPFEIDLSVESVIDSGREQHARTSVRKRGHRELPSTVPKTDLPATSPAPSSTALTRGDRAELRFVRGPHSLLGSIHPLAAKTNTIGRAADCDVQLDLPGISRYHATLAQAGGGRWRLAEKGTRN